MPLPRRAEISFNIEFIYEVTALPLRVCPIKQQAFTRSEGVKGDPLVIFESESGKFSQGFALNVVGDCLERCEIL